MFLCLDVAGPFKSHVCIQVEKDTPTFIQFSQASKTR